MNNNARNSKRPRILGDGDGLDGAHPLAALRASENGQPAAHSGGPLLTRYEHTDQNTNLAMVTAKLALPGLKSNDVTITLMDNKITISATSIERLPEGERKYLNQELPNGNISRVIPICYGTRPEDIKVHMEDGLLTLTYPKGIRRGPYHIPIEDTAIAAPADVDVKPCVSGASQATTSA